MIRMEIRDKHERTKHKMKPNYLKTLESLSFTSSICSKLAFLLILISLINNVTAAESLHSVNSPGDATDRIALLAIKSQLVDHRDWVFGSWNDSIHHCNWEGVTCGSKYNRVTLLDLSSRSLSGTISPFIGNLSFLNIIKLQNNSLSGEIPAQLSRIFGLQELRLNNNTLVGEIPANISHCASLRNISLGFNQLEGKLPEGLGALSELKELSVQRNRLTGRLFEILRNITSLVKISAAYNSFTGTIPDSFGRMPNLTVLAAGANELSGALPASLFNSSSLRLIDLVDNQLGGELPLHTGFALPRLRWLNLGSNNFSGSIPITLRNLTALEYIGLEHNSFTGRVPNYFGLFRNLTILLLSENNLVGDINFISALTNCSRLRNLQLGTNHISGMLPESVANLSTSLKWLFIDNNPITGTIPAGITNLVNLVHLNMSHCKLSGALPRDFGKLKALQSINLDFNRLSGKIPDSMGNLSYLSSLYLGNNVLEGSIPTRIGNCKSLLYLSLPYNQLNGTLGNELFEGSATFVELDLSHNHLEGSLPTEISKKTSLVNLRLSKNKFSGVIPNGLGECFDLQYLYMDGNSFHGGIPSSFASLASLQEVDFSQNKLSGSIPAFFTGFPTLYYLNLSYNDFEGRVPTNSVFGNASAVFVAGNNRLCGGIRQLHLRRCIENGSMDMNKRKISHALKWMIPIFSSLVVLVVALALYVACIKKEKTPVLSGSVDEDEVTKVSYDKLLKSTAGFSPENLIGMGSFGSVFRGILDGKTVAVKVLNSQRRGASKSFMAECNTLRNVRHRNLVHVITACSSIDFQNNDFRALIFELMPNGSLDSWLHGVDRKMMSLAQRVDVAIDVAHALHYLHRECETPIVHCDLKPSNILLDNDMVAHVGDFGLSKFLSQPQHPNQSSTTGIRGTIGYAAPEYGLGSEASTDGDVYSYGILLLELMTGKSPTNSMFKENCNLHMYAEAALPDQVLQIVDPSLEEDNLTEEADEKRWIHDALQRRIECIVTVISVGVSCSNHLPQNRMRIKDARSRLQSARDKLLNAEKMPSHPAKGISLHKVYQSESFKHLQFD
ncbi:hypothetical protein RND81_02G127700 [Saponaria officinalis]|uniref:non-specific serine/threonine protein kinase n=1 Tax=Saponaria officinalis TaxID=3572 RepID=A0AAW1ML77_SAPOF